jgi:hypothetical protein
MYDHIHRQLARSRDADLRRRQPWAAQHRGRPDRPPPWLRRRAAQAAARAANRLDAESARRALA